MLRPDATDFSTTYNVEPTNDGKTMVTARFQSTDGIEPCARAFAVRAVNAKSFPASCGLSATALNYLEVPSPFRPHLCRDSKSKRGIHNLGNGDKVIAYTADNA